MLRFAIRDLIWITALAAVGVGWRLETSNRGPVNLKLLAENARLAGELDIAKWQLQSTASLLKKRGMGLSYGGSFSLTFFDGKSSTGMTKKKSGPFPTS